MKYSGNIMADMYEQQHLEGRTCDHCSGRGKVYPSNAKKWRAEMELIRPPLGFKAALDERRHWEKEGWMDCPICAGERKVY